MPRGLDHLVLATADLDAQAAFYRRLGFQVGKRNRHDWGTLNHIVQFDGCFLELLGTEPGFARPDDAEPVAGFAGFLADYLARREGLAMVVLESRDAEADQAEFAAHGIAGPATFHFERTGYRPDASPVRVAFTLAFARTQGIRDAGFFVCRQHAPESFWNAALQVHPNGVTGIDAVVMAAADPYAHAAFFEAFTGGGKVHRREGGLAVLTPRGAIELLTPDRLSQTFGTAVTVPEPDAGPRFVAVRLACPDPEALARHLAGEAVPHATTAGTVVVPASAAFGVALSFAPSPVD
ncbi:MAG: VOC family protein [Hyphomicrobiaceae bacterium]